MKKLITVSMICFTSMAFAEEKKCTNSTVCKNAVSVGGVAVTGAGFYSTLNVAILDETIHERYNSPRTVPTEALFDLKPQKGDKIVIVSESLVAAREEIIEGHKAHIRELKANYQRMLSDGLIAESLNEKFKVKQAEKDLAEFLSGKSNLVVHPKVTRETIVIGETGKSLLDIDKKIAEKHGKITSIQHFTLKTPEKVKSDTRTHKAKLGAGVATTVFGLGMALGPKYLSDDTTAADPEKDADMIAPQIAE
jgi:hypothetical protein